MDENEEFEFRARAEQESSAPKFDRSVFANGPLKIGKEAFGDTLRQELKDAGWMNRNIAGAGTALSNLAEGAKQFIGKGNQQTIENNRIIEQEAPVGAFIGNAALTAGPFAAAGAGLKAAAVVGGAVGAFQPVEGEQTLGNVVKGKVLNTANGVTMGVTGQKIANVAGGYFQKKLADNALRKAQRAPIDKTLQDAMDAGLVVPPSSVNPTFSNTMKEGIAGKIATAQEASNRNAATIDSMSRRAIGIADDVPLTSDTAKAVRKAAYDIGYQPIAQIGAIKVDKTYLDAVSAIANKNRGVSRSFPGAVSDEIATMVKPFQVRGFDSSDALQASQFLRDKANELFKAGSSNEGRAAKELAKALEDQIERTLQNAGQNGAELLKGFRDARKYMAKAHTVEDAIVEGGGSINAKKLAQRVQAGKPMSDELAVIGNFANNFPRASQPAAQVAGPGVSKLNGLMSILSSGGGAAVGGIPGAIAGAAAPFVIPPMARSRLLSKSAQKALIPDYGLSRGNRLTAALLQNAPVGLTALGMPALSK